LEIIENIKGPPAGGLNVELELEFDKITKCHMKIQLGDFNAKVGREGILSRKLGIKDYVKLLTIMGLE
jgi:hypothetical protein